MLRRLFLLLPFLFTAWAAKATHNRAGEITFEYVGPYPALTYKITIITYTRTSSTQADRPSLDSVYFGDNSPSATFFRISKINLVNDISKNVYIGYHTYPGNGTFNIHFEDPNRNEGVINIPNSIDVPFYVESILIIDPYRFPNNSPVLTYPPIDNGCVGRVFIHNPNAYDPDGDSLSYELTDCRGASGLPIPGFTLPSASSSITLNPITGDLIWDSPVQEGEYNIAFRIVSWRRGVNLGYVTRDMQIVIRDCNNDPPVIQALSDTCVLAGDTLDFDVTAIDPNGHPVVLSAGGGPFQVADSARFTSIQTANDTAISHFHWETTCALVRNQPYYLQFRAQDLPPIDSVSLVDLRGVFIRVIGPAPDALSAVASGNSIQLNWTTTSCSNLIGYRIYRRSGAYSDTIPCPCDNGVPAYTGYSFLDTTLGVQSTQYVDDNQGAGLSIGTEYCYLVTAVYSDGSESCASPQACANLKKDLPVLTNADVRVTDANNGSVYVAWSKPNELDTVQFPPPYQYKVYRAAGFTATALSLFSVKSDLNDTTVIDTLEDTQSRPNSYKVELWYDSSGVSVLKGASTAASSSYLTLTPTDNRIRLDWQEVVPWNNHYFLVFRKDPSGTQFNLIDSTFSHSYVDDSLENGLSYCYYITCMGDYSFPGFVDPIINRSQQTCAVPVDNVPPCAPTLAVNTDCELQLNSLVWTNPFFSCPDSADDVRTFYIYYSATPNSGFERIDTVNLPDTTYSHTGPLSLAGCYRVTAVDSAGNETLQPMEVCTDTCRRYVLPSVFTPNADGDNDIFHACDTTLSPDCPPYRNVKDIDLYIYNRWGKLVFHTTDKDVNWDGTDEQSGGKCPDGVYYYTCTVNFYRLGGLLPEKLHGTIQLIGSVK